MLGHMVDTRSFVEGESAHPARVEGGVARPPAFGGSPPTIRLELPRRGSLPVEVHGGIGYGSEGSVPVVPFQPIHLGENRLEAERERSEVRHQDELELDIRIGAGAEYQVGHKSLVRVVGQPLLHRGSIDNLERGLMKGSHHTARARVESTVPHQTARPVPELGLAYSDGVRAVAPDVSRGRPSSQLGANVRQVS